MTTWTKLDITRKPISQIRFCKRFWSLITSTIKRDTPIKCLRNGIFVKWNTKCFTNCNLSQRLVELPLPFFQWCWRTWGFLQLYQIVPQTWGKIFLYSHLSLTAAYSLKSEKDWPVDFAKLWSRESDCFTTMYPKEQQTSDNLIVKDYCFITEIFGKFSFSGILRGCLSHLNEAYKE